VYLLLGGKVVIKDGTLKGMSNLCTIAVVSLWVAGFFAGPVFAGQKPSVDSCNDMGMLDVTCIVCKTGERLGLISVKAEYDPVYGDCGRRYREARQKCSEFYGREFSETGCKWSHSMGVTTYRGWYPDYCER
jgi:hypothetical protein